ncbi:MaoC/PaaZ C-terminal domain-containing protein [Bacillus dakarensis]|uniref:MaoC/PaaZ C-terminal domain-containing protein n=1 Tax=Robertmurraya dakarensis TaxID=1926278 RepID=UPI0009825840|nr:MaoC/PaaZ C-terminal domain-containing protein [Bacillus dakarensis]
MKQLVELQIGETLNEIQIGPVSRLDLIKYAGASGDYNPIHTIDDEAEKAGLPGIIAHGMWTMGNLAKILSEYLVNGFIKDYSVRFQGMIFLGDVITLKATLVEKQENTLTFNVTAVKQDEKLAVKGRLAFQLLS